MAAELGQACRIRRSRGIPTAASTIDGFWDLPRALRARWLHGQMHRLGVHRTTRRQLELFHSLPRHGITEIGDHGRTLAASLRSRPDLGRASRRPVRRRAMTLDAGRPDHLRRTRLAGADHTPRRSSSSARWRWRPGSIEAVISLRPARTEDRLVDARGHVETTSQKMLAETLPRHLRSAWPLFCEDDMIRWIPGVWQHPEPGDPSNRVVEVIRS